MKLTRRWVLLLALLGGAGGLLLFGPPPQSAEIAAPQRIAPPLQPLQGKPADAPEKTAGTMITALRLRVRSATPVDAFALQNWNPPPPPPPPSAPASALPPSRPVAPPLPFTVLGKKLEDGSWEVFLGEQDNTYVVRAQEMIGNNYRVESIAPPTAVLTYLPLNERQTLQIGSAD
jgi:hypothetical protein